MADKNLKEFRLEVGDSIIGIICPSEEYAKSFSTYFNVKNSAKEPDILINLNLVAHDDDIEVPNSLFTTKIVDGDRFNIDHDLVKGIINHEKHEIDLWVKICLTSGGLTRIFEQILYQAYYNCCRIKNSSSILLHCSGVIFKGDGYIFCGPSESGKSTVANLSMDHIVINDEICLLEFKDDRIILHGTPFNGYYKNKKEGTCILKSIFLIEHGKAHKISPVDRAEAVKRIAKEIVPPIGLNEEITSKTFIDMLDIADKIYLLTQIKKLQFLPDKGLWDEIEKDTICIEGKK